MGKNTHDQIQHQLAPVQNTNYSPPLTFRNPSPRFSSADLKPPSMYLEGYLILHFFYLLLWGGGCTFPGACMWSSEDKLQELVVLCGP